MLEKKVLDNLKNLLKTNDKIVVGVSGGPDSMCLLNVLHKYKYNIVVAHINHLIRTDAIDDENYVRKFCEQFSIPVFIKRINIKEMASAEKIGLEEAGRKARYSFYEEVLEKEGATKIATAHNKNDVAETLIMNILRGAGVNGLKSLNLERDKYIRPIINIEREEIEEYCEKNNLKPRIDSTNSDNTYTRNKIRNIVIPYIKEEFNPNIVQTLTRMSEIITVEMEYLEKQTDIIYNSLVVEETVESISLSLKEFNNQDLAIKRRIIRYTIEKLTGNKNGIEKIHIDDIIKLCNNNIGNKYLTPNKYIKVLIRNKQIYILKTNERYDIL